VSDALASPAQPAPDPDTPLGALHAYIDRLKSGELGSLPVIVAMVGITIFFSTKTSVFFTATNFNNLIGQVAGTALIAIGVVFVLLLGEIDLSVAYISGVGGVAIAFFAEQGHGYSVPGLVAVVISLVLCTAIGAFQGSFVAFIGVPSFVVTLAGNLALQAVIIRWVPQTRSITIDDKYVNDVAGYYLPPAAGWLVAFGISAALAASVAAELLARWWAGLPARNLTLPVLRWASVSAAAFVVVAVCNHGSQNGVPVSGLLLLAMLVLWTWVAVRTTFGRHVYAVGGNAEAARRSGINVVFIRLAVFMISGLMAGVGGLVLASRINGVSSDQGGGPLLLYAIAAAVIGGTSLFGGRGRVIAALLGSVVIMSISNGLDLIGSSAWQKYVITGLILLAAVAIDTFARRRQQGVGR
jgi:D-xylose transport system permease protein